MFDWWWLIIHLLHTVFAACSSSSIPWRMVLWLPSLHSRDRIIDLGLSNDLIAKRLMGIYEMIIGVWWLIADWLLITDCWLIIDFRRKVENYLVSYRMVIHQVWQEMVEGIINCRRDACVHRGRLVCGNWLSLHHIGVFLRGLEARAGLGRGAGHLVVTSDDGLGDVIVIQMTLFVKNL